MGARVVGVSSDTWATQAAFSKELGLEFPLLSDWPEYQTIATFGVGRENVPTAQRVTFIFDAEGVVQAIVDDPREMEAHPEGAVEAVRAIVEGASAS